MKDNQIKFKDMPDIRLASAHPHIYTSAHLYFILVLILIVAACSSEQKRVNTAELFNLKKYFESQVIQLNRSKPIVHKVIIANGLTDSKDVKVEDWSTELKLFLEVDISKPALKNSYRIDTIGSSPLHLAYIAVDSSLLVRRVEVTTDKNEVIQIVILKNTGNRLMRSTQSLVWNAGAGYSISGRQSVALGGENEYVVKADFIK